jgi:hypothetical protein
LLKTAHFVLPRTAVLMTSAIGSGTTFRGSSLPIDASSVISPTFIARLIKGCRVGVRAGLSRFWENLSTFNALTSILSRKSAPRARFSVADRRAKCPS